MNLFILRHGLAVEPGTLGYTKDADRPLTKEGKAKVKKIAQAMQMLEIIPDLILASPYVRARETAEIAATELKTMERLEFSSELTPEGSSNELIHQINRSKRGAEAVLLVGHEPYLSELISLLVFGQKTSAIALKKGGLGKLSVDSLEYGRCAVLDWLLTPKQMAFIAGS